MRDIWWLKVGLQRLMLVLWGGQGAQNRSKKGPGTKSRGARRHQGGTREAPRDDLQFDMGPRADISKYYKEDLSSGRGLI